MTEYLLKIAEMMPRDGSAPGMPSSNGSVARLYTPRSSASTVVADGAKDGETADMAGEDACSTERPRSNRYSRRPRSGLWAQESADVAAAVSHYAEASQTATRHGVDGTSAAQDDAWMSTAGAQRDSEWVKQGRDLQQTVSALDSNPGLKWVEVVKPTCGTEIKDKTLAAALRQMNEFSPEEWKNIGVNDVTAQCYIRVGDKFFQPAQSVVTKAPPSPTPIGGRYLSKKEVDDMEKVFSSCESPKVPRHADSNLRLYLHGLVALEGLLRRSSPFYPF